MAKGKTKSNQPGVIPNPLESLNNIGKDTVGKLKDEATNITSDFIEQLLGINIKGASGEIKPGTSVSIQEILQAKQQGKSEAKKELFFERTLIEEERILAERKTNELRVQLKMLQQETILATQKLKKLAKETQIAAFQSPAEPGPYHIAFFKKLLEYIKSFKIKIESASNWLRSANKRVAKKNMWGLNYKKHGAKYLLSSEHFVSRSAG
jgi:Fe2+ transport system protein B